MTSLSALSLADQRLLDWCIEHGRAALLHGNPTVVIPEGVLAKLYDYLKDIVPRGAMRKVRVLPPSGPTPYLGPNRPLRAQPLSAPLHHSTTTQHFPAAGHAGHGAGRGRGLRRNDPRGGRFGLGRSGISQWNFNI